MLDKCVFPLACNGIKRRGSGDTSSQFSEKRAKYYFRRAISKEQIAITLKMCKVLTWGNCNPFTPFYQELFDQDSQ